tara:strand:+ start:4476 stop:5090 length:615 start_codon:yes stop_codon:yes gene_type:complete
MKNQTTNKKILQLDRIQYQLQKTVFDKTTAKIFVAGGYITKKLQNEEVNDIDIFFSTRSDIARFILDVRNNLEFKSYYIGKNLIKGVVKIQGKTIKLDLVKRLFSDEQNVIDNFDFTICCFCISSNEYVYHPDAPFDLLQKRLNINKIPFPAGSLLRMQKYVQRDFTYCKGVVRQIMERIKEDDVKIEEEFFYEDGVLSFNNMD